MGPDTPLVDTTRQALPTGEWLARKQKLLPNVSSLERLIRENGRLVETARPVTNKRTLTEQSSLTSHPNAATTTEDGTNATTATTTTATTISHKKSSKVKGLSSEVSL